MVRKHSKVSKQINNNSSYTTKSIFIHLDNRVHPNLMGSNFRGDGSAGADPPRFVGVVWGAGVFRPDTGFLASAVGGMPISRETVYGSS